MKDKDLVPVVMARYVPPDPTLKRPPPGFRGIWFKPVRQLEFDCPWCSTKRKKMKHRHGYSGRGKSDGYKNGHCPKGPSTYFVLEEGVPDHMRTHPDAAEFLSRMELKP
jgi:hypothetical protein